MFEKLNQLKMIQEKYQEEMRVNGLTALKEALAEFFDKYPEVETVQWTQYAPYFNDGDACVFSVNDPHVLFNEHCSAEFLKKHLGSSNLENTEYKKVDHRWVTHSKGPYSDEELIQNYVGVEPKGFEGDNDLCACSTESLNDGSSLYNALHELSSGLNVLEDVLEDLFDSHVTVTCTRDEITTEEYDHD